MSYTETIIRQRNRDNIVAYSNRPPDKISGGAVLAIAAMPVRVWAGPGDRVPDDEWIDMIRGEAEIHGYDRPLPDSIEKCINLLKQHPEYLPIRTKL
jgi:hypothetical protein